MESVSPQIFIDLLRPQGPGPYSGGDTLAAPIVNGDKKIGEALGVLSSPPARATKQQATAPRMVASFWGLPRTSAVLGQEPASRSLAQTLFAIAAQEMCWCLSADGRSLSLPQPLGQQIFPMIDPLLGVCL